MTDGWLCYAELGEDGSLISTGIHYTSSDIKTNLKSKGGVLEKHLDVSKTKRQTIIEEKKEQLGIHEEKSHLKQKGSSIKARTRDYAVKGKYKTLVVLVDFSDEPAEVPKNIIE